MPPLVGAGQAIIPYALPSQEQARCACNALEIADGRLSGPYSDDAPARAYAGATAASCN